MPTLHPAEHGVAVFCGGCRRPVTTNLLCSVKAIVVSNLIRGAAVPILALGEVDGQAGGGPEPHLDEFVKPGGHDVAPHRLWPARSGTEADHAAGECGEAEVDPDAGEHGALAPLALRRLGCGGSLLVAAGQPCSVKSRSCHVGVHEHCSAAIPAVRVLGRRGRTSAAPSSLAARLSSAAPMLGHSPGQASRPQGSAPDRYGVAAETVVAARSGVGAVDTTGTLRAIRAAADGPRNCQVRSGAERQHDVGCYPEIAASPVGSAAISRPGTCSALSADDAS